MAALGAGGKVIRAFAYYLTGEDLSELDRLKPDLILLAGGTDGGDRNHICSNAESLSENFPSMPLIVAGNRDTYDDLRELFAKRDDVLFTRNVMPEMGRLDLEPARAAIRQVFLEHIVEAKGLETLRARSECLMPTPEAVRNAAELLSKGLADEPGLGELLIVDIGGATTDVFSCSGGEPTAAGTVLRGLPEPFLKRTVEADVGMRYTAPFLLEAIGEERLAEDTGLAPEDLRAWAEAVAAEPGRLPANASEEEADTALARAACEVAVGRHCGIMEEVYTPDGRTYVQRGKDLARVKYAIGTGGPLASGKVPGEVLKGVRRRAGCDRLKPISPCPLLDRRYILWALGLLGAVDAPAALDMMKQYLTPLDSIVTDNRGPTGKWN